MTCIVWKRKVFKREKKKRYYFGGESRLKKWWNQWFWLKSGKTEMYSASFKINLGSSSIASSKDFGLKKGKLTGADDFY